MNIAKSRRPAGKKALIVTPYLGHLGGGERYMLSAASALESMGYVVYFSWDNLVEIETLAAMLGIALVQPNLDPKIKKLYFGNNPLAMYLATRSYDVVFYLSDGSIPLLGGKKNIVHMQVPFHGVNGRSWKNKLKNIFINHVVVNSEFTKKVIDHEYGIGSVVLYPPVSPISGRVDKENIILSVGRFEPSLNTKHQDILIEAFKLLSPQIPGWKMVLAGGCASAEWLEKLKQMATGFPVEFATNVSHNELSRLYLKSTIYWHAAGYGIDEVKSPELTEHFGISTVEAISAGCIPLVIPYGGQKEIIVNSDFHWQTTQELVSKTLGKIKQPLSPIVNHLTYSNENFKNNLERLIV